MNFQNLIRVPIFNVRLIDVAILLIILNLIKNVISKKTSFTNSLSNFLYYLIILIFLFEVAQLILTFGKIEFEGQIGLFLASTCILIILDVYIFLEQEDIYLLLEKLLHWGSIFLFLYILGNFILLSLGQAEISGGKFGGGRVWLNPIGLKETISDSVIIVTIFSFGLFYFRRYSTKFSYKLIYGIICITIVFYLVLIYHRGLTTAVLLTGLLFYFFGETKQYSILKRITLTIIAIIVIYFIFNDFLSKLGYNPLMKIQELVEFTSDFNDPAWDKGRSLSRAYALDVWGNNPILGIGYNNLYNSSTLPLDFATAHNYLITSLAHRGILGTSLYLLSFIIVYIKAISLYRKSKLLDNDIKMINFSLIIAVFLWLIPFWNQEIIFERYSLTLQFFLMGCIVKLSDYYGQKRKHN